MGHNEWHGAIKSHRGVQVILVNIHVVEPVWVSITEGKGINAGLMLLTFFFLQQPFHKYNIRLADTHSVVFSLAESACSGMP